MQSVSKRDILLDGQFGVLEIDESQAYVLFPFLNRGQHIY